jgi:hypothetical protein
MPFLYFCSWLLCFFNGLPATVSTYTTLTEQSIMILNLDSSVKEKAETVPDRGGMLGTAMTQLDSASEKLELDEGLRAARYFSLVL